MLKSYHGEICQRALGSIFSPRALNVIIAANLAQDGLSGQIGHPEFHFDDNAFEESYAYIEEQRHIILDTLKSGSKSPTSINNSKLAVTWKAFGKLTHTAQDFYAHTNYIRLWANTQNQTIFPPPEKISALHPEIIQHPNLRSGNVYLADWLAFIPGLFGLARRILPPDSHTHMNLDSPKQGVLFPYAIEAAIKRTLIEYERITEKLTSTDLIRFTDLRQSSVSKNIIS